MQEFDTAVIDAILDEKGGGPEQAIPVLQAVQQRYKYIPPSCMDYIASKSAMTLTQLYGVATFYTQFRLTPVGETMIRVCHGTACHVAGAAQITEALEKRLEVANGGTTADRKYTLTSVACLGCCSLAPVVMIGEKTFGRLNPKKAADIIDQFESGEG